MGGGRRRTQEEKHASVSPHVNRAEAPRVDGDGRWWREGKADGKITSNMFIIVKKCASCVCVRRNDFPGVNEKCDLCGTLEDSGVRAIH